MHSTDNEGLHPNDIMALNYQTRTIWKMLGPFATASRRTPIHQGSLPVLLRAACASMSTTTDNDDRGDRYGPMEWAQEKAMACQINKSYSDPLHWLTIGSALHRAYHVVDKCECSQAQCDKLAMVVDRNDWWNLKRLIFSKSRLW